jgi:SAM-dependent methyltransferase
VEPTELQRLADALRAGRPVADRAFDRVYPPHVRKLSAKFWTPVAVAARAATLLVEGGATRVLDVGAGVGKVCIVGAIVTGAAFTGVEERRDRLEVAQRAVAAFGLSRVTLLHGRMDRVAFDGYDGFYLFNPFAEALEIEANGAARASAEARWARDIQRMQDALDAARPGARVVTYHGFGGTVPASYRLVVREESVTGPIECWEKVEAARRAA